MRYLLTCCLILASLSFLSAQGFIKKYPNDTAVVQHLIQISDGNYVMAANLPLNLSGVSLIKINTQGDIIKRAMISTKPTGNPPLPNNSSTTLMVNCPDGDFLLSGQDQEGSFICKIDAALNIRWQKELPYFRPVVKFQGNDIVFIGTSNLIQPSTLIRWDLNGNKKSENILGIQVMDLEIVNDGFIMIGTNSAFYKTDNNGSPLNKTSFSNYDYRNQYSFIKTTDDNFVLAFDSIPILVKIDKNANIIWQKRNVVPSPFLVANSSGGFFSFSQTFDIRNPLNSRNITMVKYDSKGDSIFVKTLIDEVSTKIIRGAASVNKNAMIYYGVSYPRESWGGIQIFAVKIDSTGNPYPRSIAGYLKLDEDKNCIFDKSERGIANAAIKAVSSTGQTFLGLTDKTGYFEIGLVNGTYSIQPEISSLSKYLSLCTPSVSANIVDGKQPDTVQFPIKPLISAPLMQVDITTPFLRRCFSNTYFVQYCNKGTTQAKDAFVDITLDSLIEYQSATLPLKSRIGNIYRFNLGNVEINECNKFEITGRVRCGDSTRLNQTLCVKAKIYPDTTGAPTTNWSGANITIKGGCVGDSAVFIIKNEGTAASKPLKAKTYQNEDVFESFNLQLPAQGIMTKKYKSNNKTWRITSEQEPNHPSSTRPTKFVEPCSNEPILTLQSPALAFSSDDFALSVDEDCQQIIGAYDPNDKTGYPLGKKAIGQIPENQDIEYIIRFQNTGTDTAFTVVIKDTLPTVLDASSIQWGASSHTYTPSFEGKNVAVFTFNNILLVDSFRNEPKSNGFVRFRIKQNLNLAKGTKIQNSAGIYFDFNPPIITNKTLHTIGVDEFTSPISETFSQDLVNVKVSPNPFTDKTHFTLEKPLVSTGEIEIFDLNGRSLQREFIKNQEFDFNKRNLKSGIYIFKITEKGLIIGQGKIAVQ